MEKRKSYFKIRTIVLFIFLVIGLLSSNVFSGVDSAPELFSNEVINGVNSIQETGTHIIRQRLMAVDFNNLCKLEQSAQNTEEAFPGIGLNLFEDAHFVARFHQVEEVYAGGYSFVGEIDGASEGSIAFVIANGVVSANIAVSGHFYQIRFAGEGIYQVQEVDYSNMPVELPPIPVQTDEITVPDSISPDSAAYIDLLVVYTEAARSAAGGTAAMESLINLAVSETNTGYSNGGVTQRIRLVHTAEVVYSEASFDWSTTLSRLRSTSDGYMDDVHTMRDTYGADEVVLIVNNAASCGIAYVMQSVSTSFAPNAFAVVSRTCATGYYSFAHEMGHNMGCAHDRANASVSGAYSYSYGYQAPDEAFRTIMAYNCAGGCTRINYWSNPDNTYGGQAMGVLYTDPLAADNRRSLNNTAYTVANFRQAIITPTITVTSPNGGESWTGGSSHNITWSTTGTVGNVKIEYSSNNGSSWTSVISSTANDGTYTWTVPNITSSTCLVRISEASDNSPTDTSNAVFSITSTSTPSITVISPNGGESWPKGSSQNITWSTTGTVGNVKIEYSSNNGSSWTTVVASTANDGTYTWTVPNITSSTCLVRISEASDSIPVDTSDGVFSIISTSIPSITVTSPNGGESWAKGSSHNITWSTTGTVGNVKIEYSTNTGSSWTTAVASTANDGTYAWVLPNVTSSSCLVRISEASDGSPTDSSNSVFSITSTITPALTITSPNGGETLTGEDVHDITWTSTGTVGNVKIQYSTNNGTNWTTIVTSTANDGSYSWTIPNVSSTKCKIKIMEASDGSPSDTSDSVFTIKKLTPPEINLNRSELVFGADTAGTKTGSQYLLIENSGGGTLDWSVNNAPAWLQVSPASGTDPAMLTVSASPAGLTVGTYTGTVRVTATGASNTPQDVAVTLKVYNSGSTAPPFGEFATPTNGSTVMSSVPVTGWVLDDIDIVSVKIYNGTSYIGDAQLVEGARPDVEQAYSGYPKNYKAGWGYMMLTNFLPNGGNGTYTIYAKATDAEGHQVTLGSKTITCDNSNAQKPFGAIDTPGQGGSASGSRFVNWGWALTPQPNSIPTDGSTLKVYVDGVYLGHPKYNIYRSDIESFFPGYANSAGAAGYYSLDTTNYANGVHTIQWTVTDSSGNTDGIGSRYFSIQNTDNSASYSQSTTNNYPSVFLIRTRSQLSNIPVVSFEPVRFERGFTLNGGSIELLPDEMGNINIECKELERIAIHLGGQQNSYSGFMVTGQQLKPLPIGSNLDATAGVFSWSPGPGFIGNYEFVFIDYSNTVLRKINVTILPKY